MTVLDDVSALVKQRSPRGLCDDCIAEELNLTVRQHANHKSRELAVLPRFRRQKEECSRCGGGKLCLRWVP